MANQNVVKTQMETIRRKAIELGLLTPEEAKQNKNLLDVDLDLQLYDLSIKLDSQLNEDTRHKAMLQYGNLQKIRATTLASKSKRNIEKPKSSLDKAIEKEAEELVKNKYNKTREKAISGEPLSQEEQEIVDQAFDEVLEGE